jgi:hypothetical protein
LNRGSFLAMVRTPHPEKNSAEIMASATRSARAGEAMPVQRTCPAFEERTLQGCLSPSSAKT